MGVVADKILTLTKNLYPTGRAWSMPAGSVLEKLHKALALSEERTWLDAVSILDSALPDNPNFTSQDASDWERRLGMITNLAVPLADRKLAIIRKMNHPGTIPARQNYLYLEGQLQAAGFAVYVFRNVFSDGMGGYITKNPLTISGGVGRINFQHGQRQHGQFHHGSAYDNIIANHIDEDRDRLFNIGSNLRSTFFIGGGYLGTFANVDANRKDEFRQLILRLKPVQEIGFLLINYV